ncbi:hypothetical protein, partial [Corynebacterium propinquum]|uniref:hypothetical protein n=1 Tax=Corynebacterium propinquum TaxID=43769 RepID=UPI001C930109
NATTARRIYSLIKRIFNVEVEILVRKKMKLKKISCKVLFMRDISSIWHILMKNGNIGEIIMHKPKIALTIAGTDPTG